MLDVAIDVAPLHGHRTGVGVAVAGSVDSLSALDDVNLTPYVTSVRARLRPGERRLPLPAFVAQRLWARADVPAMDRWLGRPDVVHGTNYVVPPTRAPRVVSVYDCWFLDNDADAEPDVRRAGAVLRRAAAEGAHVVTSSNASARRVRNLLDTDAVTTVHLGPPPAAPAGSPTARIEGLADPPFIVAIGTIEKRKNIPTLVAAFDRVAHEHPTAQLVLAGRTGDDGAALDRALGTLRTPTRRRVHLLGAVTDAEKGWLLANAQALAYPSLDEGFGFPILESQMLGTPVVASSAGSIPEIAGSAALLSPPLDPDALAANLYWMLTDDAMRDRLADRGRRNVDRFSWTRTGDELVQLYRRVADSS